MLGIAANSLDMFYCFLVAETPLWLNIRWGAFYVLVNVVQLAQIYWDQRTLTLDPAQEEAFTSYFRAHGMTQPQFVKLYRLAALRSYAPGETLVVEDSAATHVTLVLDGRIELSKDGASIAAGGAAVRAVPTPHELNSAPPLPRLVLWRRKQLWSWCWS